MPYNELTAKIEEQEPSASNGQAQAVRWGLSAGAAALGALVVAAWYSGHASGALQQQRLSAELNRATQQAAAAQLRLNAETAKVEEFRRAWQSAGKNTAIDQQARLQRELLKAQAEAGQYKAILERDRQALAENTRLISALWTPGARLMALKGSEGAAGSIAYAIVIENSKLVFIASNLPKLAADRQFQLWVVRKQDPKIVSAGVFSSDGNSHGTLDFDGGSVLSDIAFLEVTEEPQGGSLGPTGAKLLEAA